MAEKTAEEKVTWDRPPWKTTFEDHLEHSVVFYCSMYVASWPSLACRCSGQYLLRICLVCPRLGDRSKRAQIGPVVRLELIWPSLEDTGFCTSFSRHLPAVPRTRFLL